MVGGAMGRPYAQDLRDRVIAVVDDGTGVTAAARLRQISTSYASRVMGRLRVTGETTARALGRELRPKLADYHETLRQRVAAVPDETLAELAVWLLVEHGVTISVSRLCTTLQGLKLTRKKDTPRLRAGAPRRRGRAPSLARRPGDAKPAVPGLHQRNLGQHQYNAPLRLRPAWPALPRRRASRPLAHRHLPCRLASRRHHRALCLRRADRRRQLPHLDRAVTGSHSRVRRHRRHGQSVRP